MNPTKKLAFGLIFMMALLASVDARGEEDIFSHFKAYITVQESYDSNIDLRPNRFKRDDYITRITPGITFSTSSKSPVTGEFRQTPTAEEWYGVDLDFNAGFNIYAKNHEENYISLNGLLNGWYAVTKNLNFRVRDYLIRSDEVLEPDYSANAIPGQYLVSRETQRNPYIRNVFEPSMQYQFGREDFFFLNYRNNVYNTDSRSSENSVENFINPKIVHWFDIRNGISFEYGLDLGNFERSPDLIGHMVSGRYTYRFNPKTSVFGEYTQLWRDFERPGIDYLIYRPSVGIEHAFSPTLNLKGQVGYYWADPKKGSSVSGPFFDVAVTQRLQRTTYTLALQGGYTEDFFTAQNRGFTKYYRGIGRVSYQLLQKMNVGLFGSLEWIKYYRAPADPLLIGSVGQIDRIWAVGGNASYQILRWLTASLELSHRENHSNLSSADYSEYLAMIRVTARY